MISAQKRRGTTWLAVAAAVLVLSGVGATVFANDDDDDDGNDGGRKAVANPSEFPMTLEGHRDFQLALVNGEVEPSDDDFRSRFGDEFLAAVPPDQIRRTTEAVRSLGPWRLGQEIERHEKILVVQLDGRADNQARLTLMVGDGDKIVASTILRAEPCAEAAPADTSLASPLGEQLAWVKQLLASSDEPTEAEIREHLAPQFLDQIPPGRFLSGLPKLRALAPYTYRHYEGQPLATSLTMRVGIHTGEEARLTLAIEPDPPHRITTLGIFTQQPCRL